MKELLANVMTLKEASRRIGLNPSTLRGHIMNGKFKKGTDCIKFGGTWVFNIAALKREYPHIELGLLRGYYDKDEFPTLIEPKDISDCSNIVGYIPSDPDMWDCPRLVIDKNIVLGYFRGYDFRNISCTRSDTRLIYTRELSEFNSLEEFLNAFIEREDGYDERYFTADELAVAEQWLKDTIELYNCCDDIDGISFLAK